MASGSGAERATTLLLMVAVRVQMSNRTPMEVRASAPDSLPPLGTGHEWRWASSSGKASTDCSDSRSVAERRERMGSAEAKDLCKQWASTGECVNA